MTWEIQFKFVSGINMQFFFQPYLVPTVWTQRRGKDEGKNLLLFRQPLLLLSLLFYKCVWKKCDIGI